MRTLRHADVDDALVLSDAAGWNQTPEDWSRLISLEPERCFAIADGGRVVATCSLLVYGRDLAWLGMVLTHPDHRRRGYARRLIEIALAAARDQRIRSVKLDGTTEGEPLYRSLGFEAEQPIERWRREPVPLDPVMFTTGEIPFDLDRAAFGVDRSTFLRALSTSYRAATARERTAYALHRPGRRAWFFGPSVSQTPEAAGQLARQIVAQHADEPWFWDILPAQDHASGIAASLGFRPVRRLLRMYLGESVRGDDSLVYAAAGFEAG